MKYDVIIIGGGAAGLSAALSASGQGARVLVLEAANRVGRKILASGNGRCNLANLGPASYPGGGDFAKAVLAQCPVNRVLDFFHGLGLVTVEEDGGRVYPGCGQAASVLDVLRGEIDRRGIQTLCDIPVRRIQPTKWGLRVETENGSFDAPAVIAACGGMAGGKLGHDGGAYTLLTSLGHTLVPPRPALAPLMAEKSAVKGLSGLRLPAILTLCGKTGLGSFERKSTQNGKKSEAPSYGFLGKGYGGNHSLTSKEWFPPENSSRLGISYQGEALFTDYGVSGVCAMELARLAGEEKEKTGVWPVLYMDFAPMLGLCPRYCGALSEAESGPNRHLPAIQAFLEERAHNLPKDALLQGMVPRLLAERLKGLSLPTLARHLAAYPVPLTGVRGLEYAQVTAGGISCREFEPATLQSNIVPGLYAAGEMLDVDGACGGFNLQFAFASGLVAGENAAARCGDRK